jgi:mannuronan 5-epimerase
VIVQRPERIVVRWILLPLLTALLLNAPFLPARVRATKPSNKTVEITVDGSAGSDTNLGTADRPVKTIGQASQLAMFNRRNGVSTTVIVKPGTYREFVQLTSAGPETGASITFQASPTGAAIVSGSELFTEWQPDPSNARSYVHPWQYRWGGCEHPRGWPAIKDLGLRREMVFVNGSPMKQALARKEMTEGSFFVDEAGGVAWLWPPAGTSLGDAKVEVAVRPGIFESDGMSNLSIKGLVFEHANSCISTKPNAAVIISGGTNNLLEDVAIRWNNWIGFDYFSSTSSTARRVAVNWNGEMGINGFRLKNTTFEDVETSHNNWRGAEGQFTTWEPSGGKFLRTHGATFRNYTAEANQGRGMWFDTDNTEITIEHATIEQNLVGGIDLEASVGPITINNSRICGNLKEGIQGNQTEHVTLSGNVIYNNAKSQIMVADIQAPRTGTNWETKETFSANSDFWVLSKNTIVGADARQFVFGMLRQSNQAMGTFLSTLKSDENTWFNPETAQAFQLDPGDAERAEKLLTFGQWQALSGQDSRSRFGAPDINPAAICPAQ